MARMHDLSPIPTCTVCAKPYTSRSLRTAARMDLRSCRESPRREPLVGFEPTTCSLRMSCSTPELQRLMTFPEFGAAMPHFQFQGHCRGKFYSGGGGIQARKEPLFAKSAHEHGAALRPRLRNGTGYHSHPVETFFVPCPAGVDQDGGRSSGGDGDAHILP
jgi:hypothetical protein